MVAVSVLTIIIALLLIGAVLIQNPKGGGVDPTFGGQANQMFGVAKSADMIEKITWGLAIGLILLSVVSVFLLGGDGGGPTLQTNG